MIHQNFFLNNTFMVLTKLNKQPIFQIVDPPSLFKRNAS